MDKEENTKRNISTPIQDMVSSATKDSTVGPLIGSIIVVLLIVLGGLYYFGSIIASKKNEIDLKKNSEEQSETLNIEKTAKQSNTDDIKSIESDLKSTDIDSIDKSTLPPLLLNIILCQKTIKSFHKVNQKTQKKS